MADRTNKQTRTNTEPRIPNVKSRLADRIFDLLREEIKKGRWGHTLPSERHLSVELQVSRPTIHMALLALERADVIKRSPGQPWQVNPSHSLSHTKPQRQPIAIFLRNANTKPDMTSSMVFIDDLRKKLNRIGLRIIIENAFSHGTKSLEKTLTRIEQEHQPSFYLLISVPSDVHRWYQKHIDVPTVILGSRTDDVHLPSVDFGPEAVMRHAVNHLYNRGHRSITLLQANVGGVGDQISIDTFRTACSKHSTDGMRWFVGKPIITPPAVKSSIRKYLSRPTRSTAFILTELELIISMYSAITEMGLQIPRDVSILINCYWPILEYLSPTPTSYESPWDRMSTRILRMITGHQKLGDWPDSSCNLLPKLKAGESVAELTPA